MALIPPRLSVRLYITIPRFKARPGHLSVTLGSIMAIHVLQIYQNLNSAVSGQISLALHFLFSARNFDVISCNVSYSYFML